MGKKKAIMRKVLSCFFILVILMSVVPVSVFASANSNISSDGVNLTQSTSQSNAKSLKEGIHVLQEESLDLVLTRADYNMSIAVENVSGIGRYTEATAEGKKLLYGYPSAGTSYTTIRIDGNDYYQDTTMDSYVTQVPTIIGEDSIVTKWTLPPNVNVSQDLTLMRNTTRYRLTVTNNDHASHRVKIRYMFDTMLAYNDGAPFRVPGVGDITTEQEFINPIFDYWKAMDSLANPTLTSNCTFVPGNKPYKVQFAYWGDIYDVPFDYVIEAGQSITRDTAVGMYWDIGTLVPRETKDVIVYYGTAFVNITDIEIIELSTEFGNYLPGQNVRGYAYIGNGGNVPLVNGQLAINVTNPKDELVFENLSTITINPDQTVSRSFTYNLPVDALGGVYTINATIYDAEMNLLHQRVASFSVTAINLSISPESITTSIGGSAKYEITVKNPSDIAVSLNLSLTGLDDSWYTLSKDKESLILNAGEEEVIILNVTVPESPDNVGEYRFNVFAGAKSVSAVLNVGLEPVIYELSPPEDVILSSSDVIFSWKTSVNSTTELYIKPETEADFIQSLGESGLEHSVTVENLTRNMNYMWHVKSCSAFGCAISENRTFYIDNGIIFTKDIYEFNIERDYNQQCFVSVKNMDSGAHDLLVRAFNPYDDLYFGFIGHGSADRIISLAPGETREIELGIHAQDAMLENYTFTVNLTNLGAENITDYALVQVNVRHPHIDFNITEVSTDPITLSKRIRITNYGDPVTDLSITPDEKLKGKVMIQPSLAHCSLGSGESVDMVVSPIWSEDIRYIHGTIAATVADQSKELFVDYSCGEGKEMYEVILDHPILYFDLKGAWCINCHHVEDTFNFPPGFGKENVIYAYIGMELNARSGQTRPYNVYIGINDNLVGTLSNTFPRGYYEFDIAPSFLNYATAGIAENKYTLDTNMPGSYYTPLSNVRVVICVDEINLYICAESEEQAYDIAWNAPYIHKSSGSIMVNILSPRKGSTISLNQPTLIKAEVLGDSEGEKNCRVNATFSCSDEVIALVDNGLHGDGQADDGVYANTWTPEKAGICEITVTACNCIAEGSDTVNVTTFMFLNLTNYVAAQYNPELRTLNISAFAISPLHGKITSGVATYKILYGNDSFTGIAGNLAYNSISGYWEANNVDVGDLSEGDYKANVTIISTLTGEYGTGEAIFVISAGYGSIYGYVINGTMYPEEIVTIPDAAVSLYDSNTYYSLSPTPIATTTTNFTGGLVFENVAPGYYILNATAPHNYSGITPAFRVGSEKVHGDIIVYKTEYLSMLNEHMGNLYEQCKNVIDYETHLMAGISERFPEDIGANQSVWWMVIDFTGDVLAGGPTKLSKALIDHRIVKKHFYKEFGRAILHTTKRKLLRKTIPLDMVKYTVGYVVNYKWSRTFNDLKELDIYNNIQNNLDYQYLSFISSSRNIPVSHNFDFSDAKRVISSQTVQLSQITGEGSTIMVPADVDKPVRSFLLKGACGGYNLSAAFTNALGAANKGLSLVQIGAGGAALVLAPTGVGGGAAATLAVGASGVKMVTSALETVMMVITAQSGASAVSRWIGDLCNVPATYSDTSILLIRESSSPYYLNKSNTFNAVADINLNPTFTLPGDINVLKAPMLPPFPGMAIGQATGNIKNTGNIKSNLTVVSQVIWNYKVPPILDLFTGGVKEIPLIMSGFHHREDMPPNVQFSINIPYCGLYIDPLNMFNPHIMSINVFSGPFCVDQKTFYYYVIDPENGTVNARTSTGMMTLEQYAKFLPNETKVIATNITSDNPTFTANFTTNDSTYSVELQMFTPPGSPIDLHVYDATGQHVGYNVLTDTNDLQFPAVYYGRSQNPERIIIPDASNKTYTVQVQLTNSDYPTSAFVTVYALQTPERPAILGVSSRNIKKMAGHNQNILVDLIVGESGGQHPVYNVSATINNISNNGDILPLLTSQTVSIGTLPAGSSNNASFLLYVPENIPDGNYTGTLMINSNIGQYVVNVTVEVASIPDLTLLFILENQTTVAGESVNIPVVVINQGFDDVNNIKIEFMIDDVQIESKTVDIPALCDEIETFSWAATIGNHTVKVIVDPDNQVNESREDNNVIETSIFVKEADIIPPTITDVKPGNLTTESGDIVEFTCTATDNIVVESVWLNYTTNNWTTYRTKLMYNPYNDFYTTSLMLPIIEALEYKIEARDEAGNIGSSDTYTIKVLPTVTIELKKGWNMISLPLKPANLSASSILQTIPNPAEDRFYIWNASKGEYDAIFGDMELELGRAYRINITANGTWRLSGTETHGVQVNLTRGRNMIGVPSVSNISATDINITVGTDTCNLVEAAKKGYISGIFYSLNAADGNYDALVILSPGAKLMPGIGYFANVYRDCTITYP